MRQAIVLARGFDGGGLTAIGEAVELSFSIAHDETAFTASRLGIRS
jgi:hypothetical protein